MGVVTGTGSAAEVLRWKERRGVTRSGKESQKGGSEW